MPDHNRLCLRSTKDDARLSRLLIAHANSGTLEEPAEAATRCRREAAQVLAIRWSFHSAGNEAANTCLQSGPRLEPSTRCCSPQRVMGDALMSQSFYPSAASCPIVDS